MNILALDTSMGACSAALLCASDGARVLHARQDEMQRGHAEALMPMVAEVLAEAGVAATDLDVIAATIGPGSFTGVRIAIAAARGLSLVTGARLYGTDSLSVMGRMAVLAMQPAAPFAAAVDARRGMLYLGLYDAAGRRLDGPLLISPDDAALHLPATLGLAVGGGAHALADAAAAQGRAVEPALANLQPSAMALAEIALESGEESAVFRPLYLRPPDAKPQAQAIGRL